MMEDIVETADETGSYTVVQKEIPPKGKGYILIRQLRRGSYLDIAEAAAKRLIQAGARKIYLACTDPGVEIPDEMIQTESFLFRYDSEMEEMEREIPPAAADCPELTFAPLSPENQPDFLRIFNESFFDVPNSATYTEADARRLREHPASSRAGIVFQRHEAVGVYELSLDGETPEIASIGIVAEKRGQGLGRKTLHFLLGELSRRGCSRVRLTVSTANPAARRLYLKAGFCRRRTLSRWYLLRAEDR